MYKGLRVAVVIPAFDEEALIGQTVSSVPDIAAVVPTTPVTTPMRSGNRCGTI